MNGADLVFDVAVLEGSLTGAPGPAAVFIDRIGRPLTPLSYAGVARRTVRRGFKDPARIGDDRGSDDR